MSKVIKTKYELKLVIFENQLKDLGFKKKWHMDKSGYWFIKRHQFKDLKLEFVVEPGRLFILECQTYMWDGGKLNKLLPETVAQYKWDIKTIRKTLKRYK